MRKLILLFFLFFALQAFAQVNTGMINATVEKSQDLNAIDSIAKMLNYKGGDRVRVLTQFSIGEDGYLTDIVAKGPHPAFEAEARRVLGEVPKMDLPKSGIGPQRFSLPIVFVIETEKAKRKRLQKEKKAKDKAGQNR